MWPLSKLHLRRPTRKETMKLIMWVVVVEAIIWVPYLTGTFLGFWNVLKWVLIGIGATYVATGYVISGAYIVRSLRWRSKHEEGFSWKEERMFIIIFSIFSWLLAIIWPFFATDWNGFKKTPGQTSTV
jgi:hypothetical protein